MNRPGFHYARIQNSDSQKRIFAFLRMRGRRGATGLEIEQACSVRNAATWIAMINRNLRDHGWLEFGPGQAEVDCRYERETEEGAKVYRNYLIRCGEQEEMRL